MKKNILITGGGGFIGSHLVERCVTLGHKVKVLSPYNIDSSWGWMDTFDKNIKDNIEVILGDVNDFNLIKKKNKKNRCYFSFSSFNFNSLFLSISQKLYRYKYKWNI
tara:strand:+ start:98 stop:418 length:321 start_codon:yes stop_codon:yes gene_type:complete